VTTIEYNDFIDRSATAASILFGSSSSQDVLQILYYQLAALTSCYHQLTYFPFLRGLVEMPAAVSIWGVTPADPTLAPVGIALSELIGAPTSSFRFLPFQASHHNITGLAM
jgi:hypothetical protein